MNWEKIKQKLFNRETILYVVFGVLTTAVNYAVYYFCRFLNVDYKIANVIAWVFAVIFAFITNKLFVFESKSWSPAVMLRELVLFAGARVFSLLIEEGFLLFTVEVLGANDRIMKLIAAVFVVIINYFFSKFFIFKKDGGAAKPAGADTEGTVHEQKE
jgi:Predicted membrane protein